MANNTCRALKEAPKRGPFVEIPQRTRFQQLRSGVGFVISKDLLRYYGISNPDAYELEVSPAEHGFYVKVLSKRGAFE